MKLEHPLRLNLTNRSSRHIAINPLSTEARTLRSLKRQPLLKAIDEARWQSLTPHISFIQLDTDEVLFSAGNPSELLYLLIEGEIGLYLGRTSDLDDYYLQQRLPGDTAGDFAVLNGGNHLVNALAQKKTRLACFPRFAFELLADIDPGILAHVYETAAELSHRVMLAKVYISLFGEIPTDIMDQLLHGTQLQHLEPGECLFREDDEADGLHIVVSGRLNIETHAEDGRTVLLAESSVHETIGEFALLNGTRRTATVYATRQSMVALLNREQFESVIMADPGMIASLARKMIKRQTQNTSHQRARSPDQNFAIIPLDTRLPLKRFVQQLKRAMREDNTPLALDSHGFDTLYGKKDASQTSYTDVFSSSISAWMDDRESQYSHILYVADSNWTDWTRRCVNRADRVVLVANAADNCDTTIRAIENELEHLYADTHYRPRIDLVLLHPAETQQPHGTDIWLRSRRVDDFHHVRLDDNKHIGRLARRLSGRAKGIVFSGGGARGFAHLGVQRAIEEHEFDIDYIGGSSMGGLLGAAMALGLDYKRVSYLCNQFANPRALFDYTLPVTSLMKSKKLTHFCHEVYRDTRIEDLWIPFFCVSSNLTNGKEVIHQRGYLWKAVRSTISLPGIFSPVPTLEGQLLIDGAILNTFPVNIMQEKLGGGSIIGVNVSQMDEVYNIYNYGTSLSGWRVLLSRLNPFTPKLRAPRIAETLLRATDIKSILRLNETREMLDVLIEPDVSEIPLLDFKLFEKISEIGYIEASRVLFASTESSVTDQRAENTFASKSALGDAAAS